MRESTKWTVGYQFANIFVTSLAAIGVSFVFLSVAFYDLAQRPVFREMLSAIFITVYFGMVYSRANRFAAKDLKDYTPTKPSMLKALLMGLFLSATFALALLLYRFMWSVLGAEGMKSSIFAFVCSLAFAFYTVPYSGIMGLAHGQMMWYSEVIMLIIPVPATVLGYLSGLKGFSIMDKIAGMVYEKKEE